MKKHLEDAVMLERERTQGANSETSRSADRRSATEFFKNIFGQSQSLFLRHPRLVPDVKKYIKVHRI